MANLSDYVVVIEKAVSPELCASILEEYKGAEWQPSAVGGTHAINGNVRNVDSLFISHTVNSPQREALDASIFECAGEVLAQYCASFPEVDVTKDSGYELLRYGVGQQYKQHVDDFSGARRVLSCSFQLNDEYTGGEWGFFDNTLRIKPPKGAAIVFPSSFVFPHQINPVESGTRYSIVTWFS